MSNGQREKFNLSIYSDLKRFLEEIAHVRKKAGDDVGISGLIEEAVLQWLTTESVPKTEQVKPPVVYGGVLKFPTVHASTLHKLLDELLATDQRDHVIALLLYAFEWAENHSEGLTDVFSAEIDRLHASGTELHRSVIPDDRKISGHKKKNRRDEPPLRPNDRTHGKTG